MGEEGRRDEVGRGADDAERAADQGGGDHRPRRPDTPGWLRNLVTGVSAAVVVGVVGALVWLEPPGAPERPRIGARVLTDGVTREVDRWVVPFEVINQGTRPVERVRVVITLEGGAGGAAPPEVDHDFDHLPRGRRAEGVAVLHGRGLAGEPVARVEAYTVP